MKIKKVFIGMADVASQVGVYREGFEANGVEVMTAIHARGAAVVENKSDYVIESDIPEESSLFPGDKQDKQVQKIIRDSFKNELKGYIWEKALKECDVFFFMWYSFKSDYSDYIELKSRGKRIITNFVGSDIRWKPAMEQEFAMYSLPPAEYGSDVYRWMNLARQLHYLRTAEKYSDVVLSLPNQAQLALRPYYNFYYPVVMDKIPENTRQRKHNPIVMHAPTNKEFKGTSHVLEAFARLKKEGIEFQERLVNRVPYSEVFDLYTDSDICIGQVLCPGGGKQDYELLACGKVVLSRMAYGIYPRKGGDDCPIIDVGPGTLYKELKSIILDYPRRVALANRARAYASKYHDVRVICKNILHWLEQEQEDTGKPAYHFYPGFFREKFEPEPNAKWLFNKYNGYVKDCLWYNKYVAPGERAGLKF
jgi:hypothetical protein